MQTEETVLDRTETRKLRWFGHVMRMPQERWPAIIHLWIPQWRRKRGRPRQSWRDGITQTTKKRGEMGKKTPWTGYFGDEDWEGGGQPYKSIHTSLSIAMYELIPSNCLKQPFSVCRIMSWHVCTVKCLSICIHVSRKSCILAAWDTTGMSRLTIWSL
jgi:hypothetical protein